MCGEEVEGMMNNHMLLACDRAGVLGKASSAGEQSFAVAPSVSRWGWV